MANNNAHDNSRHTYFALDSDVLTNLAELYLIKKNNPDIKDLSKLREKFEKDRHSVLLYNFNFYNELLELAKNDTIRFLVTPTSFYECRHIHHLMKFMKKMCYVPKMSMTNYKHQEHLIRELAKAYCSDYYTETIDEDGSTRMVKHKAPLSPEYNAHYGDLAPSNDAYIMAEATIYNAILLTENGKHLCYREKPYRIDDSDNVKNDMYAKETSKTPRAKGIMDINIQMGYCQTIDDDGGRRYKVSQPYTIAAIGPILRYFNDPERFPNSNDDVFSKMQDELGSTNHRG